MKTIPEKFMKWGDVWRLIRRKDSHALYHRKGDNGEHWEVVGIGMREEPHTWPNGTITPPGEFLRFGDNDYGTCTWCFLNPESAEAKFREAKPPKPRNL